LDNEDLRQAAQTLTTKAIYITSPWPGLTRPPSGERQRANESWGHVPAGFTYILASRRNGTLYTGVTYDLNERMFQHKTGRGSKFVRKYNVTMLVWYERHELYVDAIQRETNIKRWKRVWKLELIEKLNPDWRDLTETLA
jgi:putative endonuclease